MAAVTSESLWERLIGPVGGTMTADVAGRVLALEFPAADVHRMNDLAAKARRGTLTADEDAELETYIRVGNRLSALKSKARQFVKQAAGGS
ncbi:MAG: hypothetical protein U0746_22450 [Gemmataceae bacterium]